MQILFSQDMVTIWACIIFKIFNKGHEKWFKPGFQLTVNLNFIQFFYVNYTIPRHKQKYFIIVTLLTRIFYHVYSIYQHCSFCHKLVCTFIPNCGYSDYPHDIFFSNQVVCFLSSSRSLFFMYFMQCPKTSFACIVCPSASFIKG